MGQKHFNDLFVTLVTQEEGKKIFTQIASVAKRFLNRQINDAGTLCNDRHLPKAVKLREPVVISFPNSQISASIAEMTEKISNVPTKTEGSIGFVQRMVDWFF